MSLRDAPRTEVAGDWRTDPEEFARRVERGMQRAVEQAIAEHHRAGRPVSIIRDGQLGRLLPDGTFQPIEDAAAE